MPLVKKRLISFLVLCQQVPSEMWCWDSWDKVSGWCQSGLAWTPGYCRINQAIGSAESFVALQRMACQAWKANHSLRNLASAETQDNIRIAQILASISVLSEGYLKSPHTKFECSSAGSLEAYQLTGYWAKTTETRTQTWSGVFSRHSDQEPRRIS